MCDRWWFHHCACSVLLRLILTSIRRLHLSFVKNGPLDFERTCFNWRWQRHQQNIQGAKGKYNKTTQTHNNRTPDENQITAIADRMRHIPTCVDQQDTNEMNRADGFFFRLGSFQIQQFHELNLFCGTISFVERFLRCFWNVLISSKFFFLVTFGFRFIFNGLLVTLRLFVVNICAVFVCALNVTIGQYEYLSLWCCGQNALLWKLIEIAFIAYKMICEWIFYSDLNYFSKQNQKLYHFKNRFCSNSY